jgi:hypothetical protein
MEWRLLFDDQLLAQHKMGSVLHRHYDPGRITPEGNGIADGVSLQPAIEV